MCGNGRSCVEFPAAGNCPALLPRWVKSNGSGDVEPTLHIFTKMFWCWGCACGSRGGGKGLSVLGGIQENIPSSCWCFQPSIPTSAQPFCPFFRICSAFPAVILLQDWLAFHPRGHGRTGMHSWSDREWDRARCAMNRQFPTPQPAALPQDLH